MSRALDKVTRLSSGDLKEMERRTQPNELFAIRKIAIIGTGTIGSGWAALFAARGYQVTAYCRSPASAQKFDSFIQIAWRKILKRGLSKDPSGWRKVAVVDTIAEAVASADYVQESCLEEIALKQSIIQQIDEHAPPHVIIGTSSSYIPLSLVRCRASRYPERVATVHPTLPQWDDFVEVLGSRPAHTSWLVEFFGRGHVGMDVIALRCEMHGHVHNFMLECTFMSAVGLVKSGVTSAKEVDTALVHMSRLILASGGLSGALVGCVGNGSEEQYIDLGVDIMIGGPSAFSAAMATYFLPAWIAGCVCWCISFWARLYTGASWVKSMARYWVKWSADEFLVEWRKRDGAKFEEGALKRMGMVRQGSQAEIYKAEMVD